jgi:hypothetical protein
MQQRTLLHEQVPPSERLPRPLVIQATLHGISFPFKIQHIVGLHEAATLHSPNQPLYAIPQHKAYIPQLSLLQGVYVLMVLVHLTQPSFVAATKDDAEDISGKKLAEREIFIVNYFQV